MERSDAKALVIIMDRFIQFANNWKTVGVTSKVRWQQANTLDRLNAHIFRRLADKYGEEVEAILSEASLTIGLEDGKKICENLNLDPYSTRACLTPIETISLLSGIDSEVSTGDKKGTTRSIKVKGCIYATMFGGMGQGARAIACESYSTGLVHAINGKAELKVVKRNCAGSRHCEFVVNLR